MILFNHHQSKGGFEKESRTDDFKRKKFLGGKIEPERVL
jgi:hypothetical protein